MKGGNKICCRLNRKLVIKLQLLANPGFLTVHALQLLCTLRFRLTTTSNTVGVLGVARLSPHPLLVQTTKVCMHRMSWCVKDMRKILSMSLYNYPFLTFRLQVSFVLLGDARKAVGRGRRGQWVASFKVQMKNQHRLPDLGVGRVLW